MTSQPFLDPGFTTPEMTEVWTAERRVGAILQFEAALALGLFEAGLAPEEEARAVAAACSGPITDPEQALASTWESGTPLIAILDEVRAGLTDDQAPWLHYGATSQDAVDTAHMLQAREALSVLDVSLARGAGSMRDLIRAHPDQAQIGRTFLQHGRSTTFGIRVAMWLDATLEHIVALRQARSDLALQLGGPVGNRAELGEASARVVAAVARHLDLVGTPLAWHTDRTRVWRLVATVEGAVHSMAKIALDVALLDQSDTSEVTVRAGGSSSMPGKRNPVDAIRALAAADASRGAAAMITQGRPHELDRALGSWHVEWVALPLLFHTAAAALDGVERLIGSIRVESETMTGRVATEDRILDSSMGDQIRGVLSRYEQVVGP
jgi:3-carboxy-cis,cis-muconate cycloisomerase